jgi:hypothetical protein
LAILQHLRLTTITLELCFGDIGDFAVAPSVPLQEVTFKYSDSSLTTGKASPCTIFLSPNHLEHLHATTTPVLSGIVRSPPFAKLRTLDLPVECLFSTSFIPALLRCPAVEHPIHTTNSLLPTLFEALPDGVLPSLNPTAFPTIFPPPSSAGAPPTASKSSSQRVHTISGLPS